MTRQEPLTSIPRQWFSSALRVLEERFTLRKDVALGIFLQDDNLDGILGFLTILLWAFCIYVRRYDNILRGCSPITLETFIPLLRFMLMDEDGMPRKEELLASAVSNGNINRGHSTCGAMTNSGNRHGAVPQRRKDKNCPRTAFATEQLAWFVLIFMTLDITNIHRLSIGFFVSNTLQWAGIDTWMTFGLMAIYAVGTLFWYPLYPERDSLLSLSVQRTWVYNIYSSYSLAFSLTVFLTETQFFQRARHDIVSKILEIPTAVDSALSDTLASPIISFFRRLPDYFFFVGYKFFMAFCMWFSTMMFEWTLDTSCTGIMCTMFALPAVLGDGFSEDRSTAWRDGLLSFIMYSSLIAIAYLCIPAHSISFAANSMLSAFFVFYIAAHSPRPVRSVFPLVLIWFMMLGVDAYWQLQRTVIAGSHTVWYNTFLCANTLAFGGLFMIATAIQAHRLEVQDTFQQAPCVGIVASTTTTKNTRNEHKQKEEIPSVSVTSVPATAVVPSTTGAIGTNTAKSSITKQRASTNSTIEGSIHTENSLRDSFTGPRQESLSLSKSTGDELIEIPVVVEQPHVESDLETSTHEIRQKLLFATEIALPIPVIPPVKQSLSGGASPVSSPFSGRQERAMSQHSLKTSEEVTATPIDEAMSLNVEEKTIPTGDDPSVVISSPQSPILSTSSQRTNSSTACRDNSIQETEQSKTIAEAKSTMKTTETTVTMRNKSPEDIPAAYVPHTKKAVEDHAASTREKAKEWASPRSKKSEAFTRKSTHCEANASHTANLDSSRRPRESDDGILLLRNPALIATPKTDTKSVVPTKTPASGFAQCPVRSGDADSVVTLTPAAKPATERGTGTRSAKATETGAAGTGTRRKDSATESRTHFRSTPMPNQPQGQPPPAYHRNAETAKPPAQAPAQPQRERDRLSSRNSPPVKVSTRATPAKETPTAKPATFREGSAKNPAHVKNNSPDVSLKTPPRLTHAEVWGMSPALAEARDGKSPIRHDGRKPPSDVLSVDLQEDDVPLDLAQLNLAIAEAAPSSSFEQRGITPAARSALENFAKVWMSRGTESDEDVNRQSTAANVVDSTQQPRASLNSQGLSQSLSSVNADETGKCQANQLQQQQVQLQWLQQWGQRQQQQQQVCNSSQQMFAANSETKLSQSPLNQHPSQLISEGLQVPIATQQQAPVQQMQTPMMFLRMSDGRMALCPVIPQTYSSIQPLLVPVPQVKLPQSQLRESQQIQQPIMVVPNGALPMRAYPAPWATPLPGDHNSMQ